MDEVDQVDRAIENRAFVLGVDPGLKGAFLLTEGSYIRSQMPMPIVTDGKDQSVDFKVVSQFLGAAGKHKPHVFLERPVSFGMGTKGAFTYGRGFEAIVIALQVNAMPFTLVEPSRWAKEMHEGTSASLKPKVRSLIAARRLFPGLIEQLPKRAKGGYHDGFVDALLIAGYGLRRLGAGKGGSERVQGVITRRIPDFY
jgi:hypothetical protein